mgnify:CR=1 FL=1
MGLFLDLNGDGKRDKGDLWVIIMLGLSIFASIVVLTEIIFKKFLDTDTRLLLSWADLTLCIVFQLDFWIRFLRFKGPKTLFLKTQWLDFITAIPAIPGVPGSEIVRALRLFKCWKLIRTIKFENTAKGAFAAVLLMTFITVFIGSIFVLHFEERAPGSNIKTPQDALWWSMTTVTTVGYGDKFPVTGPGRAVAAVLMMIGTGLFATLAGFISSKFAQQEMDEQQKEIEDQETQISHLKGSVDSLSVLIIDLKNEIQESKKIEHI